MCMGTAIHRRLCWGTVYILAAGVVLTSGMHWECPTSCRCTVKGLVVNCSAAEVTMVPAGIPEEAKLLNLTHNTIKTLVYHQFHMLTQLLHLDLSDNILGTIDVEAFVGLRSLMSLRLTHNHLKIVPVGAFTGLTNLQFLDISSNEILVFLDFTFRDLAKLQFMNLIDNDLVFIAHQAFDGLNSLQELHLDVGNLTAVPTEAFAQLGGLKNLHVHQIGLRTLPNYSLRHLAHLKELNISKCPWLEMLSENSLFGLNLTSLTIQLCNLSAVPYVALHHFVYLVHLDLSYNPITYIHGNLLGDLLRLQELRLVGASLVHIEIGAFRGLVHFKSINVSKNLLTTLEAGVFHSLDSLEVLGLDNNPLTCDCRLLWMAKKQHFLDLGGNPPTCTTSVQLQSWTFLDLSEQELQRLLTCRRSRIINRKPQRVRVDQGHTVVFYCNAAGEPVPSVSWLNPHLRPLSSIGRIRALSNGTLEVRFAQPQDSGTYLCMASNAAGNDSLPFSLHVKAFPPSSKIPFRLKGLSLIPSAPPGINGNERPPFDIKTLLIATTIGFFSFFSSVSVCFLFMLFWSKSRGQIKHTATIAYVPRSALANNNAVISNRPETSRFTMKLI